MTFDLKPEEISAYGTAFAAAVAAVALAIAAYQIKVSRSDARRGTAHQIYKDYLRMAMENPKFSSAAYPRDRPLLYEIEKNPLQYESYEYYVASLLFAAEGILESCSDKEWTAALTDQMKYHALYLKKANLLETHYSSKVCAVAARAIKLYEAEQSDA
jgi:hypothetical protein